MRIKASPAAASLAVYGLLRAVCSTLRLQVLHAERIDDLIRQNGKGVICVLWHGKTFVPIHYFRNRGYWSMISTSRDGEYQDKIFKRFGFNTVRGSTSARGAVQATLTLVRQVKSGSVLAVTPDGPRGPRACVQPGVIYLAMKSGCPIIPVGLSSSPCKLMGTWDEYMIPLPFSRSAIVFGEPIYIPGDARSEEEQNVWAQRLGVEINALERQAELLVGYSSSTADAARSKKKLWSRA